VTLFWLEKEAPFNRFVSDLVSDPDSDPDSNLDRNSDPKSFFEIEIRPKFLDPSRSGSATLQSMG